MEVDDLGVRRHMSRMSLAVSVLGVMALVLPVVPLFTFPAPGGPYAIGTVTYHWVDESRPEIFTSQVGDRRELMVQIWYPAKRPRSSRRARYLPDARTTTASLERLFGLPRFALGSLGAVRTHAIPDAKAAGADRFPVLLFLEGLGGFRQMNTFQIEHFVSRGYVVVALDQPHTAASVVFPDGRAVEMTAMERVRPLVRQSYLPAVKAPKLHNSVLPLGIVPRLAEDVTFVLDELQARDRHNALGVLTHRLDLKRVGAFGSSLGGLVIGEAARSEHRLRALLIMDAPTTTRTVADGLDQPTMWITRPADAMREERRRIGGWSEEEIKVHHRSMRATFDSLRAPGWFIQVPRMSHLDFTDVPLYSPMFRWAGATGPIDARRAHQILNDYGLAFFDQQLRGRSSPLLEDRIHPYQGVIVERHVRTNC